MSYYIHVTDAAERDIAGSLTTILIVTLKKSHRG